MKLINIADYLETCSNCVHYTSKGCGVPGGWRAKFVGSGIYRQLKCADFKRRRKREEASNAKTDIL